MYLICVAKDMRVVAVVLSLVEANYVYDDEYAKTF